MSFHEILCQTAFYLEKQKSFKRAEPRANWLQYQNNQLCLLTEFSASVLVRTMRYSPQFCVVGTIHEAHLILLHSLAFTLPTAEILSDKNARAWVSMVLYLNWLDWLCYLAGN